MLTPDTRERCSDTVCVAGDPETAEPSLTEERQLDDFEELTQNWKQALDQARSDAEILDSTLTIALNGARRRSSNDPRTGHRQGLDSFAFKMPEIGTPGTKNDYIATLRNLTLRDVKKSTLSVSDGRPIDDIIANGSYLELFTISNFLQHQIRETSKDKLYQDYTAPYLQLDQSPIGIGNTIFKLADDVQTVTKNPYPAFFMWDYVVRAELAMMMQEMPDTLDRILDVEELSGLPDHMQQMIAFDISRDKQSLVLNFITNREPAVDGLFEYLNGNNMTEAAKNAASAIKIGSTAVGDCDCPLNRIGLCRDIAERIPSEILPVDIRSDMDQKRMTAQNQRLSQLRMFANEPGKRISAWWNTASNMTTKQSPAKSSKARKRQTSRPTQAASFDKSIESSLENSPAHHTSVGVTWRGIENILEAPVDDEAAMQDLIANIFKSKMVAKYLREHRTGPELQDFMQAAIGSILTLPMYRNVRGIRPVPSDQRYGAIDGVRLNTWRLSGAAFRNGAGKIGADTRIYFGIQTTDRLRRIELLKVVHKADTAKALAAGQNII